MRKVSLLVFLFVATALPVAAQSNIRSVDFQNFNYRLRCGSADSVSPVRVRNGAYSGRKRGLDVYLKIYAVEYGDLNNDGQNEAVVLYACGSGASYVYFRGFVFGITRRRPHVLAVVEGGNKGDGGFHDVVVSRNQLVVERYQLGAAGSPCCPVAIERIRYRLNGRRLVQVGGTSLREISNEGGL